MSSAAAESSDFDGLSILAGSIERLACSRKAIIAMQQQQPQSTDTVKKKTSKRRTSRKRSSAKSAKSSPQRKSSEKQSKLAVDAHTTEIDDDNAILLFPNGKKVMCYHMGKPLELYAVRRGKNVRKCLFFHWDDCKDEILGCDNAVYETFDDLISAATFAFSSNDVDDADAVNIGKSKQEEDDDGVGFPNRCLQSETEANTNRIEVNSDNDEGNDSSDEHEPSDDEEFKPDDTDDTSEEDSDDPNDKKPAARTTRSRKRKLSSTNDNNDNQRVVQTKKKKLKKSNAAEQKKKTKYEDKRFRQRMRQWMPQYNKLKAYYEEHGDCKYVDMYHFIEIQGKMYRKYCEDLKHGKEPDLVYEERIKLLNEINFDFESTKINLKWLEYYEKAKMFIKENPDFVIPMKHELLPWVAFQREDFKRLRLGKPNTMTIEKLQKLNEMGFPFSKMERLVPWEERREQLKEFRKENKHLKVPLAHPVLGNFCAMIRKRYWNGKMNPAKLEELNEMGFVWQAGNRHINTNQSNFKSWEYRFEEVVEYKRRFGNCLVPQHWKENPTLGGWVAKQRKGWRLRKEGKKCSWFTTERALKLTEIGFVFDYTEGRGRRRVNHHHDSSHNNIVGANLTVNQHNHGHSNINNLIQNVYDDNAADDSEVDDYEW